MDTAGHRVVEAVRHRELEMGTRQRHWVTNNLRSLDATGIRCKKKNPTSTMPREPFWLALVRCSILKRGLILTIEKYKLARHWAANPVECLSATRSVYATMLCEIGAGGTRCSKRLSPSEPQVGCRMDPFQVWMCECMGRTSMGRSSTWYARVWLFCLPKSELALGWGVFRAQCLGKRATCASKGHHALLPG